MLAERTGMLKNPSVLQLPFFTGRNFGKVLTMDISIIATIAFTVIPTIVIVYLFMMSSKSK